MFVEFELLTVFAVKRARTGVIKQSAAELSYLANLLYKMREGSIRCVCTGRTATDPHHPLGSFWESGKGLKAQ